jgi:hypothetical protein
MIDPDAPITEEEVDNAVTAVGEEQETGTTSRRCLRCGGRLIYEDRGSGFYIRCENGDFEISGRGL